MKVKKTFHLHIGLSGCEQIDEHEYDTDDFDSPEDMEREIAIDVREWAMERVEWWAS